MFQTKLYVDENWMNRLGFGLQRFKKVKKGVYVCRCPFCGDSKKRKSITRFYFYTRNDRLNVQCKNCGYSHSFFVFMKDYAPQLFDEYKKETLLDNFKPRQRQQSTNNIFDHQKTTKPKFEDKPITTLKGTVCVVENQVAKTYLYKRGFSNDQMKHLLYTNDFKSVASQLNVEASKKLIDNEPRIVIPFYDADGAIKLIQGRTLKPSKMKYITIKINDDIDKIYGVERINQSETVYCVEGPLDSLFVDNCIATCDANLVRSNADVLIFDNEPRNADIVKLIESAIKEGRSVVIWPNSPDKKLDINDMIKAGISQKMLMNVIKQCTYKGLMAELKFRQWKKV